MKCQDAQPLIQGYLDGEITEAQAGPLRKHLLACTPCRTTTQDGKALKAWFVDGDPVTVPVGFAARVARRAFAGDRGEEQTVASGAGEREAEQGRMLSFVLQLTAVAAALLMAFSIGIRTAERPSTGELHADDASKAWALNELDLLNAPPEDAAPEEGNTDDAKGPGEQGR